MTANIILTIVAVLALFLAVISIRASKKAHDKLQTWEHCLEMRSANTGQHFEKVHSEISSLRNALFAANSELAAVRQNFDLTMEQKANSQQDHHRLMHKFDALAARLGLYWDDHGRWTEYGNGAIGGGQVMAQGAASGNQISAAKQRGRRRT